MKKIDLIILGYTMMVLIDFLFLMIVERFEIIIISGPLALIPLVITVIQRKRG